MHTGNRTGEHYLNSLLETWIVQVLINEIEDFVILIIVVLLRLFISVY